LRGFMEFNTEKSSCLEKRYRTAAGLSHLFFSCPTQMGRGGGVASERTEACSTDEDFSFVHLHFIACAWARARSFV